MVLRSLKFNKEGGFTPYAHAAAPDAIREAAVFASVMQRTTHVQLLTGVKVNVAPESDPAALIRALEGAQKGAVIGP